MKKTLLIICFMAAGYHLKAQQFFQVKPADSLTNELLSQLKVKPDAALKLLQPNTAFYHPLMLAPVDVKKSNVDHMPIAVLAGNSKMPVVKLGGYYTMPVKKMGTEEVITVERPGLSGLPTLSKP
ncbi:hypothetical protein [Mucilaginibacter gotjawali]|uniref:Uncharacterized protein n=2 Tax=Mucilaginibacter gotjawali TaxID=1550579 RepID=A0A839SL39_9SPHI|nr:hypothetical protein [Mucilaginibacter gotjawali]MBB3058013.1 hypothetical protein [Mucilaginibacter gotjawali]BAU51989.1 hypothetical protein MgSA37_00139 [Mucilaginibacter gotjawali]